MVGHAVGALFVEAGSYSERFKLRFVPATDLLN